MKGASEAAFFIALARFAGLTDGRGSSHLCDLSGGTPGRLTATDVIDRLSDDVGRPVPEAVLDEVLVSYTTAYNKSAREGLRS